jgi:hypothetical protein
MNGLYEALISSEFLSLDARLVIAKERADGQELASLRFSLQSLVQNGMRYFFNLRDRMIKETEIKGERPYIRNPSNGDSIILPRKLYPELRIERDDVLQRFLWGMDFVTVFGTMGYDVNDYVIRSGNVPKYQFLSVILDEDDKIVWYRNEDVLNLYTDSGLIEGGNTSEYKYMTINYQDLSQNPIRYIDEFKALGLVNFTGETLPDFLLSDLPERLFSHEVNISYDSGMDMADEIFGMGILPGRMKVTCIELDIPNPQRFLESCIDFGEEICYTLSNVEDNEIEAYVDMKFPSTKPSQRIQEAFATIVKEYGDDGIYHINRLKYTLCTPNYECWYQDLLPGEIRRLLNIPDP